MDLVPITEVKMTDAVKGDVKWLRRIANIGFGNVHVCI